MVDPQKFDSPLDDGQTPLDPDEAFGLKLSWVATRGDLNDAEGANVFTAMRWAAREIRKKGVVVPSEDFLQQLHSRMFGDVWRMGWPVPVNRAQRQRGSTPDRDAVAAALRQCERLAGARDLPDR